MSVSPLLEPPAHGRLVRTVEAAGLVDDWVRPTGGVCSCPAAANIHRLHRLEPVSLPFPLRVSASTVVAHERTDCRCKGVPDGDCRPVL